MSEPETTRVEPAYHSADVEIGTGSPVAAGGSPALHQTIVPTREQIIGRQISNGCYTDTELDGQPCCDGCWCVHEATMEAEGIVTDG